MTLKAQATGPNVPAHYDNHNSSDDISCIVSWLHEVVLSINRVWVLVVSTTRPELSDRRKCIKRSRNARGSQVRLIKIARRIFRVFYLVSSYFKTRVPPPSFIASQDCLLVIFII